MVLAPRLDLRQSQSLVMTPQLQQAIKLLQLNNVELSAFVESELEKNPLLERDERPVGDNPDERQEPEDFRAGAETGILGNLGQRSGEEAPIDVEHDNNLDEGTPSDAAGAENAFATGDDFAGLGAGGGSGSANNADFNDLPGLEERLSDEITLREHIDRQINLDISQPAERLIASALLDGLDDAGYLRLDLAELADSLNVAPAQVEAVLGRLQGMDPPGIFARDLAECLKLQLIDQNRFDPAMAALLENLELLARRDLPALMKLCGVNAEDIRDMINEIRALNPKPAGIFTEIPAQPIVPDVIMRPHPDGGWQVELNSDTLPRVLVNNAYYARISRSLKQKGKSAPTAKDDKTFVTDQLHSANWLVKALDQRANTILKVATELVRQQDAFFLHGISHLKPLILRDISEAIDMHESTVSRVTSNKYMLTPRGIFELKYFFTQAIAGSSGAEAHSAETVRHRIKAMIDNEGPKAILSDDTIVDMLKKDGIDIARRTVAKYREGMHIGSSVQRRREKRLKG